MSILHYKDCVCGNVTYSSREFCWQCIEQLPPPFNLLKYWRDGMEVNGHKNRTWQNDVRLAKIWLKVNGIIPRSNPLTESAYDLSTAKEVL